MSATFVDAFEQAIAEDRGALFPYMMCGVVDDDATVDLFAAMTEAGADGFEIGIPYADPLMDGPVIQAAGQRALEAGMTVGRGLDLTARITAATGRACAVMTYVNPVLTLGPQEFASRVAAAGGDALIIADLPVDEAEPFLEACSAAGIGLVLFAAPTTTDARLDRVVSAAQPFVYGVAEMGVTGERAAASDRIAGLAARVRSRSEVPLVFGVGISSRETAAAASEVSDGVIVGSALVRRVLEDPDDHSSVSELVGDLAAGVREASPGRGEGSGPT